MNKKRFLLWTMVAIWAFVIFMFSAQPADVSSSLSGEVIKRVCTLFVSQFKFLEASQQEVYIQSLQFIVRKTAHLSVYLILGVLVISAMLTHNLTAKKSVIISACICFLYACSDEIHQLFVPGRAGMITDVLIDTTGAFIGIAVVLFARNIIMRKRPSV